MLSFQGHVVWPYGLIGDIFLALLPIACFCIFKRYSFLPKIGRNMNLWDILSTYIFVLFIPNTIYAMFEIKHLLFIDNVADHPDIWSYIVFGGISLLGLITLVVITKLIIKQYAKNNHEKVFYSLSLSLICGFGVISGLLEFNSWEAFNPFILITIVNKILATPTYIHLTMVTVPILFLINLIISKSIVSRKKEIQ